MWHLLPPPSGPNGIRNSAQLSSYKWTAVTSHLHQRAQPTQTEVTTSSTTEVTASSPAEVTTSSPAEVTASSPAEVTTSKPAEVTASSPAEVTTSSPAEVTASSPAEVTASSPAEVTASSPAEVTASSPAEVTASSPAEVTASSPAEVTASSPAEVITSSPAEVTASSPAEVTTSSPAEVTTSSATEVTASSPAEVTTSSATEVTASSPAEVATSSPAEVATSSPAEVTTSSATEVATSSPAEVTTSSATEVTASSPADVTSLLFLLLNSCVRGSSSMGACSARRYCNMIGFTPETSSVDPGLHPLPPLKKCPSAGLRATTGLKPDGALSPAPHSTTLESQLLCSVWFSTGGLGPLHQPGRVSDVLPGHLSQLTGRGLSWSRSSHRQRRRRRRREEPALLLTPDVSQPHGPLLISKSEALSVVLGAGCPGQDSQGLSVNKLTGSRQRRRPCRNESEMMSGVDLLNLRRHHSADLRPADRRIRAQRLNQEDPHEASLSR
ncbi:unnamed protein product [Pleuronectes platessa]|uniref:Uncharacterized protein n=1 Tax=Pleuronectes platessa TaxID=8262 RepID=A0A9N7U1Z7_PLEPL|nr:unnamed protein product [Pleuronectes platessa]